MMSFTCQDIRRRWAEYLYRELDEPEQSQFVKHINRCPKCGAEEERWRALLSRFDLMSASDGAMDPPPELVFRVKRQIRLYEDWTRQTHSQVRNWLAGAAVACALIFGGAHLMMNRLPLLNQNDEILKPITHSVLNRLYNEQTLQVLSEEGIFKSEETDDSGLVAGAPEINKNESDSKAESTTPAS